MLVKRFNHTSWVAVVTPADHLKSLCYRSFWWRFCVVTLLYGFCVGVGAFVLLLSQISSFSLFSEQSKGSVFADPMMIDDNTCFLTRETVSSFI